MTFQEYLAGLALAGLPDQELPKLLLKDGRVYRPEWREVVLLLAGVLHGQGVRKVDGLAAALLDRLGKRPSLIDQARCVGLLGAILRDLQPFRYKITDNRYAGALQAVLGIFDAKKAAAIEFQVRLEAAEALGQAGDPRLTEDNWVTIEAGTFRMGAQKSNRAKPSYDREARTDESPVHEVHLNAYRIARYPVTVEEYRRFVEDDGYRNEEWWKAGGFGEKKEPEEWDEQVLHPNRPVVSVSWYEAAAYCAWAGVRLPTEAEWERAARGREGRRYPWRKEAPDPSRANYDETNVRHSSPVGLFPRGATPEGIHDLASNVWEWVGDWFAAQYYRKSSRENPKGPAFGGLRVVRGSSWKFPDWTLRSALRNRHWPEDRTHILGFRCAREVVP